MRIGEIAHDFRYEASGALKGIERGRHFCQNDAHLFVTPEQIKDEFSKVCDLIFDTYKDFGITDYRCVLSLRDPTDKHKYHDDDAMWNTAENALREVLNELGIEYTEEIGEAAFYGPKLDVNVKPAVGAEYTLSTCQLDFCLPAKFHLTYIDSNGEEKTPVVLHRAILGSSPSPTGWTTTPTRPPPSWRRWASGWRAICATRRSARRSGRRPWRRSPTCWSWATGTWRTAPSPSGPGAARTWAP